MKSYDETINTVFDRISEYKTAQKRKKKIIIRTVLPVCCVALATLIGIGVWQSDMFKPKPSVSLEDSTVIGEKDYIGPDELDGDRYSTEQKAPSDEVMDSTSSASDTNAVADILGSVVVDGIHYMQYHTDENLFTTDICLGDARDFEGTYNSALNNIPAELYSVKESPNVLLVKLGNGATTVLGRFGELVVNGSTYYSSQWKNNEFTQDKYLGTAAEHEIITVPYRETIITPQDEIWTAKEDADILLVKQSNGNIIVYHTATIPDFTSLSCIDVPNK